MKELLIYKKPAIALLTAVKKPAVIVPAVGIMTVSDCVLGIFLLLGLMALDFVTGVLASWNIWKSSKIESNFWKYGFSSSRIRLSIAKSVTYFLLIICSYGIEVIFRIKSFGSNNYTDHELTLSLLAIAFSCSIEMYSIFFENLPKAGFDIWNYFKKMASKIKSGLTTIKDITKNDSNGIT
ncbi:phage holin family protein [Chryseobacterium arthrosphaerae]|uniref:phage holin family protein n=1 Tax=Chryseobacterium arthrosphaerae TaxID=651561 RepID=UPI003D33BD17